MGAPEKPPHGAPCNGCGLCCQICLCPLGEAIFGFTLGKCPALELQGDRFGCGLVANPQRYRPTRARIRGRTALSQAAVMLIGSGIGCDATVVGETRIPDFDAKMKRIKAEKGREIRRAKITWGIGDR